MNPNAADVLVYSPYEQKWMPPEEWLEAQLGEAARRRGARFVLQNLLLRLKGRPTLVPGPQMERGTWMVWEAMRR